MNKKLIYLNIVQIVVLAVFMIGLFVKKGNQEEMIRMNEHLAQQNAQEAIEYKEQAEKAAVQAIIQRNRSISIQKQVEQALADCQNNKQ